MRLGKTLVTVRRINQLGISSVLVVAPYSTFESWRKELRLEGEGKPVELTGPAGERVKSLYYKWPVTKWYLINKEGFLTLPNLYKLPWNCLVLDESTFIKNPRSQVSRYYTSHFQRIPYKFILTGLPDPESELDYFQQMKFLDPAILEIRNFNEFKFKNFGISEFGCKITNKGKKFLKEKLSKHCFFLSRKEAGYYKEPVRETRLVKMPDKIRKIYNKIKKEFILETDEYFRMTKFAGTKFSWMREICNGVAYKNETDKELIWDGKIKLLEELLEGELKGVPLVIWCAYTMDIKSIAEYFRKKIKLKCIYGKIKIGKREHYMNLFKGGHLNWLIIQPKCMQYGADLSLTSTCIYYSTPVSLEVRKQSEQRIEDIQKKEPSLIIDLVAEDTIEEKILKSLERKENRSQLMRNLIRSLRNERKFINH